MTGNPRTCPECGADWSSGLTCQEAFYQMGAWELDHQLYDVHHLMVLCYHLQHPSLYSPEGLAGALGLLAEFVEQGSSPSWVRRRDRARVDSGARKYKIKGTPDSHGSYPHPVRWTVTTVDVTAGGLDSFYENVRAWAQSVLAALRSSGNYPPV